MKRIETVRMMMLREGIAACVVPNSDPHLSEYIPDNWALRRYFSGFSGSAGTLVITPDSAFVRTDSRYFLQAEQQLQGTGIELMKEGLPTTPELYEFLAHIVPPKSNVFIPALLYSTVQMEAAIAMLAAHDVNVVTSTELLLTLWDERPSAPSAPLYLQHESFSGASTSDRVGFVRERLEYARCEAVLMSDLADIAWLMNVRGSDVDCNPVALAYAYVSMSEAVLFVDPLKLTAEVTDYLSSQGVVCAHYDLFLAFVSKLNLSAPLLFDSTRTNYAIRKALPASVTIIMGTSPATQLKAIKNDTELKGIRNVMRKDGVALVRFLRWLREHIGCGETEYTISEKLCAFREQQPLFVGDSFSTIAGVGPNGAIVHYHPQRETSLEVNAESLLLLDSGGQYFDGTSDITRTFALTTPSAQQIADYTMVLKGHIAIAMVQFPIGTKGGQLDILARKALWDNGLNYGHGTGHGVGHFLNVHEGPQSIRPDENPTALEVGMVVSNEPGLYRTGEYGIRIENLVTVEPRVTTAFGGFLGFETLTLFPYERALIDVTVLTSAEVEYVNRYHERVFTELSPLLSDDEVAWLRLMTAPLCNKIEE